MKVELITTDADPDRGGFGARVHAIVNMLAQFADVRVVRTAWFGGPRLPRVEYRDFPIPSSIRGRLSRWKSYYQRTFPKRREATAPDLVIVESLDLLGLHQYGPRVPLLLDEHNVYWDLLRYELANTPFFRGRVGRRPMVRRWLMPRLLERAKEYEVAAIRRSLRTLVTSEVDREAIARECPESLAKLRVLPNCVDLSRVPPLPEPTDSQTVSFVGHFAYGPNRDGAKFVSDVLAPALPSARFLLVGANPPQEGLGRPNVVATGRVPDLQEILAASSVCIAPLAQGSGTRIKILTYLSAAKAVVATTKACEGLPVVNERHVLIRDDPAEFREAVARLLDSPGERRRLGDAGRALVESSFDWRVHVANLRTWCEEAIAEFGGADQMGGESPKPVEVRPANDRKRTREDSVSSLVD